MKPVNPYKVIGNHPVLNIPVDLRWYRGASRYNNGATLYGRKYLFRYLIAYKKEELKGNNYSAEELATYRSKQAEEVTTFL